MNKKILLGLLILSISLLTSCSQKLNEIRVVSEKPEFKMLIAGDSSDFKDTIRNRVIEKYKALFTIHVVNIDKLKSSDASDYNVVLIMDTCMAWGGFNPSMKSFMENKENRKKTVLLITAGDPHWNYSYKEVDAVTSASVVENQEAVFARITNQINGIINVQPL